jgi:hypothetical protein
MSLLFILILVLALWDWLSKPVLYLQSNQRNLQSFNPEEGNLIPELHLTMFFLLLFLLAFLSLR